MLPSAVLGTSVFTKNYIFHIRRIFSFDQSSLLRISVSSIVVI